MRGGRRPCWESAKRLPNGGVLGAPRSLPADMGLLRSQISQDMPGTRATHLWDRHEGDDKLLQVRGKGFGNVGERPPLPSTRELQP